MATALPAAASPPGLPAADAFRAELLRAAFGPELPSEDVHRTIAAFAGAASPNTLRALRSDLKRIDAFQRARGLPALPLTPAACFLLLDERARAGSAKASIDRLVASAIRLHQLAGLPSPVDDTVRWKLKEVRKADTRVRRQARGLRIKGDVADVHADEPQPLSLLALLESIPTNPAGLRDRALLSCAYDAGLRRSEVVRARVEHFEPLPSDEASLFLPRSKTDQEGEGARVWMSARTMRHVAAWQEASGLASGYLFRPLSYRVSAAGHLSEGSVAKILKQRLADHLVSMVALGELSQAVADEIVKATFRALAPRGLRPGPVCRGGRHRRDHAGAALDLAAPASGLRQAPSPSVLEARGNHAQGVTGRRWRSAPTDTRRVWRPYEQAANSDSISRA